MICSGLISIDHLKEHIGPVSLVCQRIPRWVFEKVYNISLPKPFENEDPNRPCTAEELLQTYGKARGFMTQHGQPNEPKTARLILKDYVNVMINLFEKEYKIFIFKKKSNRESYVMFILHPTLQMVMNLI